MDNKKELKAAYKDRELDGGIMLISFATGNQSVATSTLPATHFLMPVRDFRSSQNRLIFSLGMKDCVYKDLQEAFDTYGNECLQFEVVEKYEPSPEVTDITEDLRTLLHLVAQEHPTYALIEPARI